MRLGTKQSSASATSLGNVAWKGSRRRRKMLPFQPPQGMREKKPGASLLPAGEANLDPQPAVAALLFLFQHDDVRTLRRLDVQQHALIERRVLNLGFELSHALDVLAADLRDHIAAIEPRLISRAAVLDCRHQHAARCAQAKLPGNIAR